MFSIKGRTQDSGAIAGKLGGKAAVDIHAEAAGAARDAGEGEHVPVWPDEGFCFFNFDS